jgi:putative membrane protein
MKRLTIDMVLAGTLAVAPLAKAQDYGGATQDKGTQTEPATPRELPPAATPTPPQSTTTGSERAGNQPSTTGDLPGTTNQSGNGRAAGAGEVSDADLAVVRQVHEANQKEIDMGQLAADKAKSPAVKSYARKLVDDHKTMDRQLMSFASKNGLQSRLERTASATSGTQASDGDMHARLQGETGSEFDRDFASTMVEEHDKAIQMVRSARDSVGNQELRTLLGEALPKLEKHRKMAQDLVDKKLKS